MTCGILQRAVKDRIAQVYMTALSLLRDMLPRCARLRRGDMVTQLDQIVIAIVEKLSDNNARQRSESTAALVNMAKAGNVGCPFIASHVLRSLKKKDLNGWRPVRIYGARGERVGR